MIVFDFNKLGLHDELVFREMGLLRKLQVLNALKDIVRDAVLIRLSFHHWVIQSECDDITIRIL